MKKVVSLLLSLAMVLGSCISLNCFAEETEESTKQTARNMKWNKEKINEQKVIKFINDLGAFVDVVGNLGGMIGGMVGVAFVWGLRRLR